MVRSSVAAQIGATSNRLDKLGGATQTLNAAGEHRQLGDLSLSYDNAGRLVKSEQSQGQGEGGIVRKPWMPFAQTTHRYNGQNQCILRENGQGQTVYVYGREGHEVLGEYQPAATLRWNNGLSTEHVWLPTASLS